jgi:hypothetical protein
MRHFSNLAALGSAALAAILASAPTAQASQLQTPASCQVGMQVTTSDGHAGTITRVDRAWSYCYVRQDDTGKEVGYLYSLLQSGGGDGGAGGGNAGGNSGGTLPAGVYECFADGHYTFMDIRITGPETYSAAGGAGDYRVEGSGQIIFTSGSLQPDHGKLLSGGRIGLNTNGDSFYATSCELNRNRR